MRNRNQIFYTIVCTCLIVLFITFMLGRSEDKQFLRDYSSYQSAEQLIAKKNFSKAEVILKELVQKEPANFRLLWRYGLCLAARGEIEEANKLYAQVAEIKPTVFRDQEFVTQWGEILFWLESFEEAKEQFSLSKKINEEPTFTMIAEEYLRKIENKMGDN